MYICRITRMSYDVCSMTYVVCRMSYVVCRMQYNNNNNNNNNNVFIYKVQIYIRFYVLYNSKNNKVKLSSKKNNNMTCKIHNN